MNTHDPDDESFDAGDGLDALHFDAPAIADDDTGLDALAGLGTHDNGYDDGLGDGLAAIDGPEPEPEDAEQIPVVQAVNPPGTVTVTAYLSGAVAQVDLDPKVTTLTESQLAEEIRFVAEVAAKKATAVVHVGVVDMLVDQGMDLREARDFVETHMPFSTPEAAVEAQLALIARHTEQEDQPG
ncbi:hypothetical protein M1247_31730 [Mycobacterium sp. 21AC1]|uniref:hypothetical protein n=1 Tax=[Mycobacterium] appelbergii TaxID=2939269 RepID=UPI002938CFB0|nr:hypothetical protein [Mycobacterium sp. 21AC1]MDV3129514.1 hypothetical protein [Mycobacterium sp. 21AC1]